MRCNRMGTIYHLWVSLGPFLLRIQDKINLYMWFTDKYKFLDQNKLPSLVYYANFKKHWSKLKSPSILEMQTDIR